MSMKKSKRITIAVASMLLAFSAASTVTGTVAWFTANNIVNVSGMQIQAEAEEGIVISNEAKTDWKTAIEASHTSATNNDKGFIPTSTANATTWYHANSDDVNKHQHAGDYATLTVTAPTAGTGNGVGTATVNGVENRNIYLLNHFYVQSAINTALTGQDLFVSEIEATDDAGKVLNKSLRVLFKVAGSDARIYCPLLRADFSATENAGAAKQASTSTASTVAATDKLVSNGTIPAYTAEGTNAIDVSVYMYFEGEDTNCKSANIDTLSSVTVSFKLENRAA